MMLKKLFNLKHEKRVWRNTVLFCMLVLLFVARSSGAENGSEAELKRGYADSRFGQIHYRISRPVHEAGNRTALVALHLSPNSGQVFSTFLPLMGRDRIALAPDYPGYGMSDPIAGVQRIEDYAAAMLDVIEYLDIETPVDLLGYHTGTAVALEMARQRPAVVRKVMLVAVPVITQEERAAGAALPMIVFDEGGEFAKEEWRRSWKWRGPGQSKASVLATFSEKMRPGVRDRGAKAILAYDIVPALTAVTHPTMIVRVHDDLWAATARARELRTDTEYIELPEFGHGLFHAAPDHMGKIAREFFDDSP